VFTGVECEEDHVADAPLPFWRKIAEAIGMTEPEVPDAGPTGSPTPAPAAGGASVASSPSTPSAPSAAPPANPVPIPTPAPAAAPTDAAAAPDVAASSVVDPEALLELWFALGHDDRVVWRQCRPGPSVDEIATRLSLIPPAFLAADVAILPLAEHILDTEYGILAASPAERRAQQVLRAAEQVRDTGSAPARRGAALALWLWASDDLHGPLSVPLADVSRDRALAALAFRLAAVVDPAEWVSDADRRDEAARQFLFWSGHLPAGEDEVTARSILAMRDSVQQNAALAQALADHEHRLEVTRRLQAARAREASARYSSE
jgi:hypothetical protein